MEPHFQQQLEGLYEKCIETENTYAALLSALHPSQRVSGTNLLDYLAFRSLDIRQLQLALHREGFLCWPVQKVISEVRYKLP